jgi:hypothetical protein
MDLARWLDDRDSRESLRVAFGVEKSVSDCRALGSVRWVSHRPVGGGECAAIGGSVAGGQGHPCGRFLALLTVGCLCILSRISARVPMVTVPI